MSSDRVAERLESRLPQPVEDEVAWFSETDDDEDDGPAGSIEDDEET